MVQAVAGAAGTLLGALSSQPRKEVPRPVVDSATNALALTSDKKIQKILLKNAREERIYNLLMQPEIMGLAIFFLGLLLANNIPFSKDEQVNNYLQGIATTGSTAIGMGYAGVGDLTSLAVALAAGAASIIPDLNIDLGEGSLGWLKYTNPLFFLLDKI